MSGAPVARLISEYTAILRGFGLSEDAIAEAHAGRALPADASLEAFLARTIDVPIEPDSLHARLGTALAQSPQGIDAPAEYWNNAPEVHLREVLAPYGCEVRFEATRAGEMGADPFDDGEFRIELLDAHGSTYATRFEYPDTALGDDNYPALIDAVERELLGPAGLQFVLLPAENERWRFVMVKRDRLAELRGRCGDRIEVFGEPLLAPHQPADYLHDPPLPPWIDGRGEEETADEIDLEIALDEPDEETVETDVGAVFDDIADASGEEVIDAVDEVAGGGSDDGTTTTADGVEASDEELDSVFGDLSEVDLEPTAPEPEDEPAADEPLSIDAEAATEPAAATDGGAIDNLFDELERDVVDDTPGRRSADRVAEDATVEDLIAEADRGEATTGGAVDRPTGDADGRGGGPVDGEADEPREPEPEITIEVPDPAEIATGEADTDPEPVDAESEPVDAEPEPVDAEPEPIDVNPAEPEPEPVDTDPEPADVDPAEPEPEPVDADPEPVGSEPIESNPDDGATATAAIDGETATAGSDGEGEAEPDDADGTTAADDPADGTTAADDPADGTTAADDPTDGTTAADDAGSDPEPEITIEVPDPEDVDTGDADSAAGPSARVETDGDLDAATLFGTISEEVEDDEPDPTEELLAELDDDSPDEIVELLLADAVDEPEPETWSVTADAGAFDDFLVGVEVPERVEVEPEGPDEDVPEEMVDVDAATLFGGINDPDAATADLEFGVDPEPADEEREGIDAGEEPTAEVASEDGDDGFQWLSEDELR